MREPRLNKVTIFLSDDELVQVQKLVGGMPISPYLRTLMLALARNPSSADRILRAAPPQPHAEG